MGILTGVATADTTEIVDAITLTETGTPDAYVQVPWRHYLWMGESHWGAACQVELNQTDGDSATLSSGEEYLALVWQNRTGDATADKGSKAAAGTATAPDMSGTGVPLAVVTVSYQAATSVIVDADIDNLTIDGRFRVTDNGAASFICDIGSGRALTGGAYVRIDNASTYTFDASETNYLWVISDGFMADTTGIPPSSGAVPLAKVITDGSGVTSVTDLRQYHEAGADIVVLRQSGDEATGTNVDRMMIPYPFNIDRVSMAVMTAAAGGATGSTTCDVNKVTGGSSATLFTNQGGANESLPTIATGGYLDTEAMPEVVTGNAGDYLTLDVDAITATGSRAAEVAVALVVYRRW